MDGKLTYEQMEAAFYLVARDLCFVWFENSGGPFLRPGDQTAVVPTPCFRYEVGPNLGDTFYYACADTEAIPWGEVAAVAGVCKRLPDDDANLYLTHWAARRRGHDPQIPAVKAKLDDFRRRHPDLAGT